METTSILWIEKTSFAQFRPTHGVLSNKVSITEIAMFKNRVKQTTIQDSAAQKLLKNTYLVMLALFNSPTKNIHSGHTENPPE